LTLRSLENPWINAEPDLNGDAPHQRDLEREESAASSLSLGDTHIVRKSFLSRAPTFLFFVAESMYHEVHEVHDHSSYVTSECPATLLNNQVLSIRLTPQTS
jgi:hypothetical protein